MALGIIIVIILVIGVVYGLLMIVYREAKKENQQTQNQISELKRYTEKERHELSEWVNTEMRIAESQSMSLEEIRAYAEKNFRDIMRREKETFDKYRERVGDIKFRRLKVARENLVLAEQKGPQGHVMVHGSDADNFTFFDSAIKKLSDWYEQPLKALLFAKQYEARGGEQLARLEAEEWEQKLLQIREEAEKKFLRNEESP